MSEACHQTSNLLYRREILALNKLHQPLGFFTPKKIFTDLYGFLVDRRQEYILDRRGKPIRKMVAYDVDYEKNSDDTYNFDHIVDMRTVDWDTWVTLPIRSFDLVVHMPKQPVRVPRIVIVLHSAEMPETKHNTSLDSIYNLYDGVCQYTKRKLKKSEASRDHVIPRSKGGKNNHSNIVLCDRDINSRKGDNYNWEVGLPEVLPIIPKKIPVKDALRNTKNVPEWRWILK